MKTVKLHDKEFILQIGRDKIEESVMKVAQQINEDLKNESPLFLSVLNGAFMYSSDLMKHITISDAEISFVKIGSYCGTESSGVVKDLIGLNQSLEGRCVVILEDMVDTGRSMKHLIQMLKDRGAEKIVVSTMFFKPNALVEDIKIDYHAMVLENDFVIGYGLDYDGLGRQYPDLYVLKQS